MLKPGQAISIGTSDEIVEKCTMGFGQAEGLGAFTEAYRFFSPALPYLYGRFTDRFLVQFLAEMSGQIDFLHHRFERSLFAGMESPDGDGAWNSVLWALDVSVYPDFEKFLLSVAVSDPARGSLYRVGVQDVEIVDPLWHDHAAVLSPHPPTIPVTVFGVNSNRGAMAVDWAPGQPWTRPRVCRYPADAKTCLFTRVLFGAEDLAKAMDVITPAMPAATKPLVWRTQDMENLSPEKRAEYQRILDDIDPKEFAP